MSALLYLLRCSFMNIFKRALKKPLVMIGYFFTAAFIGVMIWVTFTMPNANLNNGSDAMFRSVMTGIFGMFAWFSLRMGIDKGSSYFRTADVNLAFTAPFRPNQILLYGFMKNVVGTLFLVVMGIFQMPNLKNQFTMLPYGPLIIMLAILVFSLTYPVYGMLIYSWTSKSKLRRKNTKRAVDLLAIAVAVMFLLNLLKTRELVASITGLLDNAAVNWVPVVGWMRMITAAAVDGIGMQFFLGIGLMVVLFAGVIITLYRMNLDFYEDVLEATDYLESAIRAKAEGKNMQFGLKVRKSVKGKLSGSGAKAVFHKNILEMRKTAYFLFVDRTSLIVVIAAIAFRLFMPDEMGGASLFMVLAFSVYMQFLFTIQGKWQIELGKPYLFLLPATAGEKMFYATLSDNLKNLLDGTVLFVTAGILFKGSILDIIICIISYTMFGAVFLYGDILSRRLFGGVHSKGLQIILKLLLTLFILLPGIAGAITIAVIFENTFFVLLAFGGWASIAAFTLFFFSLGAFNTLEAID